MITKVVASTAIVFGLSVLGAAPANAEPSQSDLNPPNPFAGLTCNCQPKAPFGPFMPEVERGLQAALAS